LSKVAHGRPGVGEVAKRWCDWVCARARARSGATTGLREVACWLGQGLSEVRRELEAGEDSVEAIADYWVRDRIDVGEMSIEGWTGRHGRNDGWRGSGGGGGNGNSESNTDG
jgi:hypothetical protein